MKYLKEKQIYFKVDQFNWKKCASVDQIVEINSTVVHQQSMLLAIYNALIETTKKTDPEIVNYLANNKISSPPPLHFKLVPCNKGYRNGPNRVNTRLIDIQCVSSNAPLLELLLANTDVTTVLPTCRFIQMTSPQAYQNVLITQNKFLNDTMITPIYGMLVDTTTKQHNELKPIKEILEENPAIIAVYPTANVAQGKWLVKALIDTKLLQMIAH